MVSFRFAAAMAVLASTVFALPEAAPDTTPTPTSTVIKNPIETPTTTLPARAIETKGCYSSGEPLENHGSYLYRTDGNCQLVCLQEGKNVMGLSDGENCWCGDLLPPLESKVDDKKCNTPCSGDKTRFACGGPGLLYVALTGKSLNEIEHYEPPASSSTSSTPTASAKPATSSAPANNETESKPNTVAIAVGVVVGIVALVGIGVGIWFFLRRRRQRQAEEDYRRNAANVNAFVNGGKGHTATSSLNDSRLDPSFMDRRTSSGSIADNEDYSRRILKVTNA